MALIQALPAVFFLAIAVSTGDRLCSFFLPALDGSRLPLERRYVAPWVIRWPLAFLSGALLVTWATYLVASLLRHTSSPMAAANLIVLGLLGIAHAGAFLRRSMRGGRGLSLNAGNSEIPARRWIDITVTATGLVLGAILMFHTCRIVGDTLVLGRTAFGDLNIHLGMARSFSAGDNFPTGYVAFASNDIRYHFMFYFLVGNLEFLGLPLDWAINLPSILSFTSVLMLLHAVGSVVIRDARAGGLTVLFLLMRSSPAAFVYFSQLPGSVIDKFAAVVRTDTYIGITNHENWGIWNLNVYVVERHFAFAFGIVLIAVLYLVRITALDSGLPLLRDAWKRRHTPASPPT